MHTSSNVLFYDQLGHANSEKQKMPKKSPCLTVITVGKEEKLTGTPCYAAAAASSSYSPPPLLPH